MKLTVFKSAAELQTYAPPQQAAAATNRTAFHCLPATKTATAANTAAAADSPSFHARKPLTTAAHSLQCTTCLKYRFIGFPATAVPTPPFAGKPAAALAGNPAGACSTTAGVPGGDAVRWPKW